MLPFLLSLALLAQPEPASALSPAAQAAVEAVGAAITAERTRQAAAGPPESLRGELARRVALEQAGRRVLHQLAGLSPGERSAVQAQAGPAISAIDRDNVVWLKRNLPADGWFRISRDGVVATQNAFLIVQHSGDQAWMKQVLARMEPLARRGEVRGGDFALLYDRTALADGRSQRYGSQLGCEGGKFGFQRMEDPAGADARRKAVGLTETLAEYARHFPDFGQPC